MRDVADVGEVEDVEVVADLDLVLAVVVGADEAREGLAVAFAEDARGADGAGQELGAFLAVGGDDSLFSLSLSLLAFVSCVERRAGLPWCRSRRSAAGRPSGRGSAHPRCASRRHRC